MSEANQINFVTQTNLGAIHANFDEIERDIDIKLAQYSNVIFTEDAKADAKKTVADLRKEKKKISDAYKEVKILWMEPLESFKQRVDELSARMDKPIDFINGQVEAFEEKRLEERKEDIQTIYDEEIGDMQEFLPLYHIKDDRWMNSSKSLKAVRKELIETVTNARAGKSAIESMQSDAVPDALKKFRSTLNLAEALAYINQYEAQRSEMLQREEKRRKQEDEQRHQDEIERIRLEERQRIADEERIKREAEQKVIEKVRSVNEESAAPLSAPDSHTSVYTVVGTDEELMELETAMTSLGIYFERKDV